MAVLVVTTGPGWDIIANARVVRSVEPRDADGFAAVIIDGRGELDASWTSLFDVDGLERILVFHWASGRAPGFPGWTPAPFSAWTELYGSPVIHHLRGDLFTRPSRPSPILPPATHGPGVFDDRGRPALWSFDLSRIGKKVPSFAPQVVSAAFNSRNGTGPVPFEHGFPAIIPAEPIEVRDVDGTLVRGVLARDPQEQGGWKILESADLLELLGHSRDLDVTWEELRHLLSSSTMQFLVDWLEQQQHIL